jgi:mannose-6-phosphate isomerase-like protein (cupin superfamily)
MARVLEGGCRVSRLREGRPRSLEGVRIWTRAGRGTGARAISLRVLEFARGVSPGLRNAAADEVLFVLEGEATVHLDGWAHRVGPEMGLFVAPGVCLTVDNPGPRPFTLVGSRCPDPADEPVPGTPRTSPPPGSGRPAVTPVVRLADRPDEASGDRSYRVLVDASVGSTAVTQFVGSIPPGRAGDHFHRYEEVLCILEGRGRMWAGRTHAPIGPGSCIFLPRRQVHCVENAGPGPLKLLGVFYPAGSPAARVEAAGRARSSDDVYRSRPSARKPVPRK